MVCEGGAYVSENCSILIGIPISRLEVLRAKMTMTDLLLFLFLTSVFGSALVHEVLQLAKAMASRKWLVGEAEIIRASTEKRGGRHGGVGPLVEFRYWYDGREYQGSRLVFGSLPKSTEADVAKLVARFQPGSRWAVNIDPQRPQDAVLQPGPHRHNWFAVCFLGCITAVTATMLVKAAWEVTVHHSQSPLPAQPALERQTTSKPQ